MTVQMTIDTIKARIENEAKTDSPDWGNIIRLAENGKLAEQQLVDEMEQLIPHLRTYIRPGVVTFKE